jgi:hypothetical protein
LQELQAEYKRSKEEEQRHTQYESFNVAGADSWEDIPEAVAGAGRQPSFEATATSSSRPSAEAAAGAGRQPYSGATEGSGRQPYSGAAAGSSRQEAAPTPGVVSNSRLTVASVPRNSFLTSPRALLSSLNPFGSVDSEEEYDASGKNPFAE